MNKVLYSGRHLQQNQGQDILQALDLGCLELQEFSRTGLLIKKASVLKQINQLPNYR